MRVVVTRPEHSGERTARRLAEMGHEAILLPLTKPVHDAEAALKGLEETSGAIAVTSTEIIRVLEHVKPSLRSIIHRPLFAVGNATAQAAREIGFKSAVGVGGGNGAQLAELISQQSAEFGDLPLLYLAGSPRAAGFEARLAQLGIAFRTVECYRMEDVMPDIGTLARVLVDTPADAILFYSRETARRFFALPFLRVHSDTLAQTRMLCLSGAVAEVVPAALQSLVEIAAVPDEDSLLALLAAK
ncbi:MULTISPECIES: uroporphyrinogen-III synthase [unclassified Rhizobium]|uniref:uroporphyrinogen-III synthase n=1 Tax=unclassified Rhizobium TaxID=2613769 RepID=UPI000CDF4AC3|nr:MULTISPECIES: uroporphyrinogen-III synthase [Rhizobium]AVA23293.1 uroporphyrinogen-III synthase [Rhizobium sp. NXC24]MDK4739720.1 uroporphyrinogen-III synthase [Rhizobium sp. CNPSo 3464]UWU20643.1 uroporphyrinogen-III synthase [Rhizobium tropici]